MRLNISMVRDYIRNMRTLCESVSRADLCSLLDMTIQLLIFAFHYNGNAEYAWPDQLVFVLSSVEAVSQPNAPDNIAVL